MGEGRGRENDVRIVGRYAIHDRIAAGGMATVHLGRLAGEAGFGRTVAIKRLHAHLVADPTFADMFADEARVAARIRHPNVVPTLDVVRAEDELLLVMEYVDGEALSHLFRAARGRVPLAVTSAIVSEILHGLHAAHEARDERGEPLCVVHRDVSPQNALVGADGVARLVDFGIARATGRVGATADGDLKGKLAYMAPEQIRREPVTRRTDVYAAGIVLWELLTGRRLFASKTEAGTVEKILVGWVPPPSSIARELPHELDDIVLRALAPLPSERFRTAREMAVALEDTVPRALGRDVSLWVEGVARESLQARRALVARVERAATREDESTDPLAWYAPAPVAQLHTVVMPTSTLPPRARRAWFGRHAAIVAGAAAVVALSASLARSREPAPPSTKTIAEATPIATVPPAHAVVVTTPAATAAPSASSASVDAPPSPAARPAAGAAPRAPIAKRPAPPARRPCTARVDPKTMKTVYQGDCE